jgi:type I restriction enzyme, S subunit
MGGPSSTRAYPTGARPDDWEIVPFGEAVSVAEGQVNPTEDPYASMPHVGPECVESGTGRLLMRRTARDMGLRSGKYLFQPGDIVYSKIRPYLRKSILADFQGICSADMYPLTARPEFDAGYLNALILSDAFTTQAIAQQDRTGIPKRNREQLSSILVPKPPLAEQRRITAVVSILQTALGTQDRIIATLKELKAATMAKLFREGLHGQPLKQTEIGEIPESWELVELARVASIERGKFAHRPRNDPRFYGGSIPFIQTGDVAKSNGRIREYAQTLNDEGLAISRVFPKGTIVLTIAANIADTGILEFDSAFPDSLVGITVDQTMDPAFVEAYLRTQKREMDRLAPKGTQKNINIQFLKPWPVPRPLMDEQKEIAQSLSSIDDRLDGSTKRLETIKGLFSSMLQLLMTGQLRVRPTREGGGGESGYESGRMSRGGMVVDDVEQFVGELVRRFGPERVILFGARVPGSPSVEDRVGLLVVMGFEGRTLAQAVHMERELKPGFPLQLVVLRPEDVSHALEIGNAFVKGILERGKVLYAHSGAETKAWAREKPREERPRAVLKRVLREETLREIVQRVVKVVAPERIILFGSAARGEMGPDSDVDLLVVKPCANPRETATAIYRNLRGVGVPVDIVVVTPEDIDRDRDTIGYIIRPALREGRVVYAA